MKAKLIIIGLAAAIRVQADTNFFEILTCGTDTYTNATINQVTPTYATVTYAGGVVQVPLRDLPENVQQQYHYNSNAAAQFRLEQKEKSKQLRAAEAARKAAAVRQAADEAAKAAQIARSPAGLDAEAAQMRAAGKMEFTIQLFENFPEKVVNRYGWIDAYFQGLDNIYVESKEDELGFDIRDINGDSYSKCHAIKTNPHNDNPDPVISEIMNLKRGDKVRFIGMGMPDVQNDNMNKLTGFYVTKIEMIETAAEKKAGEQATKNP
jgi:hypothetical protein